MKDFIEIFPNAASEEYCEKVINRFDYIQETQHGGRGRISSRQDEGAKLLHKENDTYALGNTFDDELPLTVEDKILMSADMPLFKELSEIVWNCYDTYTKKYGALEALALHKIAPIVRIQKYKPSQGYHVWHCDASDISLSRRILVITLYLNTVEEGGETEFLYQNKRISPIQGTLSLSPSAWTHTHRGNPPLKGNKYIITTWIDLME